MSEREAFEEWCRLNCSPRAESSDWYWRIFQAGAAWQRSTAAQPTDALEKFARDLAAAQTPLDPAAAKVLRENLHDLYMDGGTSDNGSESP